MFVGKGVGLPGWKLLGDRDDEVAFGAVGRFWQPRIQWRDVPLEEFAGFAEPGWGKIARDFTVLPYDLVHDRRQVVTERVRRC